MRDLQGIQCASGILCMENLKANTWDKQPVQLPYAVEVKSDGLQFRARFSQTNTIKDNGNGFTLSTGGIEVNLNKGTVPEALFKVWSKTVGRSLVNKPITGYGDVNLSYQNGQIQGYTQYFQWLHQKVSETPHWFVDGIIEGDRIEAVVGSRKGNLFGFLNRHTFPIENHRSNFSIVKDCLHLAKGSRLSFNYERLSGQLIGSDQRWKIKVDMDYQNVEKSIIALMIFMMGNEIFYARWREED